MSIETAISLVFLLVLAVQTILLWKAESRLRAVEDHYDAAIGKLLTRVAILEAEKAKRAIAERAQYQLKAERAYEMRRGLGAVNEAGMRHGQGRLTLSNGTGK